MESRIKHYIPESKVYTNAYREWWTLKFIDVKVNEFQDRKIIGCEKRMPKVLKQLKNPEIGSFEVYFMGVCLFSKFKSRLWPNIGLVVEKCRLIHSAFLNDESE